MDLQETQTNLSAGVTMDSVKTSNDSMSYSSLSERFKAVFDEAYNRLLHSKSLTDIYNVFRDTINRIGCSEFVISLLLLKVYEIYKNNKSYFLPYGYTSIGDFIRGLEGSGINNKTSFYDAVRIGRLLCNPSFFSQLRTKLTYTELFQNWSKVKLLGAAEKIISNPNYYGDPGVIMEHFHNDSYIDFAGFVKELKSKTENHNKTSENENQQPAVVKTNYPLNGLVKEFYNDIHSGRLIGLFPNINQRFLENARDCIELRQKKKYDEQKKLREARRGTNEKLIFDERLEKFKHAVVDTMWNHALFDGAALSIPPDGIKDIINKNFKRKTDCELAVAFLINRLNNENELKSCLTQYHVSTVKDFAVKILCIKESQYKRLTKIGENLRYIDEFKGDIDLTSPGFLEKLYFLDRALKSHNNDTFLILRCLNHFSAMQFRRFAKDPHYNAENDPIMQRDYNTAYAKYEEYQELKKTNDFVSYLGLYSKDDIERIKEIALLAEINKERFEQFYPEIPWVDIRHEDEREPQIADAA